MDLNAGTTTNADVEMKIGQSSERVEVTAEPPLLENTPSNFSTGVSTRYMEDLPLQGRDIQKLVRLFPGLVQSSGPSGMATHTSEVQQKVKDLKFWLFSPGPGGPDDLVLYRGWVQR